MKTIKLLNVTKSQISSRGKEFWRRRDYASTVRRETTVPQNAQVKRHVSTARNAITPRYVDKLRMGKRKRFH
jgi:hypothetical protein